MRESWSVYIVPVRKLSISLLFDGPWGRFLVKIRFRRKA